MKQLKIALRMKRFTFRATQIWLLPRKEMVRACPGCPPPEAHHPGMSRAHHRTPPETQVQPSLAPTFLSAGDVQSRGSLAHRGVPSLPSELTEHSWTTAAAAYCKQHRNQARNSESSYMPTPPGTPASSHPHQLPAEVLLSVS